MTRKYVRKPVPPPSVVDGPLSEEESLRIKERVSSHFARKEAKEKERLARKENEQRMLVLRKIFSEDIEEFGKFFFPHHFKLSTPNFHRDIFNFYQGPSKRIALGAPRGHAKSTITDLVYLLWEVVHRRKHFVLLVSDTYGQAAMFLETVKAELESNEKLIAFYGNLVSGSWSEGEIIIGAGEGACMVRAVGAGNKVRGAKFNQYRPDLIIVDDLENDELVENFDRRDKLSRWVNGALIPTMEPEGRFIIIGTILHFDSLLFNILNKDGYSEFTRMTYKAINPWGALWPEHLSLEALREIQEGYARKGQGSLFYQEYQNEPISAEDRKFKNEKFKFYTEEMLKDKQLVNFVTYDRAYSLNKTADFTGKVVVSVDNQNNWYVRVAQRLKVVEADLIRDIFETRDYWKPMKLGIEQKAYEFTLKVALNDEMRKQNTFFLVEELKDGGVNKSKRIEGLLPRFETGTIFFKEDMVELLEEMQSFPRGLHDDLVDALAHQLSLVEFISYKRPSYTQKYNLKRNNYF